ncbi:MAG TPA: ATP-dependent Clp protease proteolytic subunit [Verrucomicrobiae bacterium]|jgi:hypothetical protein|nr:ATP-dependent Clp protease proteolytic subunit [Verrucomicrobiae bacterium]
MGYYTEYLGKRLDFKGIEAERKKQLLQISKLRGNRDVLVYAADLTKPNTTIDYTDILPIQDQLANLNGTAIDFIIETPGGFAEAAEDMITMIRGKYKEVGIVVPGWAKSAGTILAMAGDEILMGTGSALGPIDAQIGQTNGKRFSAHAFLEGFKKIKEEVAATGKLNPAYIPSLQNISPGEIQHAENAQLFSERLVSEWLENYKFKNWTTRRTSGEAVTPEFKKQRAKEIAEKLSNQSRWLTHGRSIRIAELEGYINLRITDYSKIPELNEAITRYYTLLRMAFETNLYKLVETSGSQIYRYGGAQAVPPPKNQVPNAKAINVRFNCGKCKQVIQLQANFEKDVPLKINNLPFPANNVVKCPSCETDNNVGVIRLQLEAQTNRKVISA